MPDISKMGKPAAWLSGGGASVYLLWQLVGAVNTLSGEVKEMKQEFRRANNAFIVVATRVDEHDKRLTRQGEVIENLRKYHERPVQ